VSWPGLRPGTRAQAVPFQWKISVSETGRSVPQRDAQYEPTAQVLRAEAAATPDSPLRGGLGMATCLQAAPFQ